MTADTPPAIFAQDTRLENALLVEMVVDDVWTNAWIHSTGGTTHIENDPLARPTARSLALMLAETGALQFGLRLIPASRVKNLVLGIAVAGEGANIARNLTLSVKL